MIMRKSKYKTMFIYKTNYLHAYSNNFYHFPDKTKGRLTKNNYIKYMHINSSIVNDSATYQKLVIHES